MTTKIQKIGAAGFVRELKGKGFDLMDIAHEVSKRYHQKCSHMAIKRFLDGDKTAPRAVTPFAMPDLRPPDDGRDWDQVLIETAEGLLEILNDESIDGKARLIAGENLLKLVMVGSSRALDRELDALIAKRRQQQASSTPTT